MYVLHECNEKYKNVIHSPKIILHAFYLFSIKNQFDCFCDLRDNVVPFGVL